MTYKIGIITSEQGLFQNGLVQNAYFLYEVFQNAGHTCTLLCYNPSYKKLDGLNIPVKTMTTNIDTFDPPYDIIITVGKGITKAMYQKCKLKGIRVIGFVCGNILAMNTIGFLSKDDKAAEGIIGKSTPVDYFWLIEGHSYMKGYLELLRGAPVHCVPHLWSPRLLVEHTKRKFGKEESSLYFPKYKSWEKINVLILEPNNEFLKTSLIPIAICEWLEQRGDRIKEVFVFNFPVESAAASAILENFKVTKKLRRFKGLHTGEILSHFNSQPEPYVVISHQINNPWNYLYYEMLHFGVPLIHNSDAFKGYGYHYTASDVEGGGLSVLNATDHHEKLREISQKKNSAFLKTIDPIVEGTVKLWGGLL
jgi:hypothetical protein